MERESPRISNLQAYAFEYATGVLWAMDLLLLLCLTQDLSAMMSRVARILTPLAPIKFSDTLTAFIVIVAGVVLPYALAMALRPISLWAMNGLLYLGRWIVPSQRRHKRRDLHVLTTGHVRALLGITSETDYPELLAVIAAHDRDTLDAIEWLLNEVVFRAASVLPSALLVTLATYPVLPPLLSIAIGVFVLLSGAAYAIQMLSRWRDRAEALVILLTSSADVPKQ